MTSIPVYLGKQAMLLIVSSAIPMLAHAQRTLASVDGDVKDSSGVVLPNVEVVVADLKTQVETRTTTDNAGLWERGGCESRAAFRNSMRVLSTTYPSGASAPWTDSAE
jgi:hypothetical protein